jgi:hypothetical protein
LSLSNNGLDKKTSAELKEAFSGIPAGVTTLNLGWNDLSRKTSAELKEAFSGIPVRVTILDLTKTSLYQKTGTELNEAFSGIPAGVTTLDLSQNHLYQKTSTELKEAFSGIPTRVRALNLSSNSLGVKTSTELKDAFSGIPVGVATLNLTYNSLNKKTGAELKEAFSGIPAGVTTLDLSSNYLYQKTGAELKEAFSDIPAGVTTLNLSDNSLEKKTSAEFKEAFSGIPAGVATLKLGNNGFGRKSNQELIEILQGIPKTVTELDLSNNALFTNAKLNQETDTYFQAIMDAAPQKNIQLGKNGYSEVSRVMAVFFRSLIGYGGAPFKGDIDLYKRVLSFLVPNPYAQFPNHPFAQGGVMDYYLEKKPSITPWLTETFIRALLTKGDLRLLAQARDYLSQNNAYAKPYQECIDLFLFLRGLEEVVRLSNPRWKRTFEQALDVMKTQIIQTLDNQDMSNHPREQQQFNTAYRAAIAISQRHLKVGVDNRASEKAFKKLKLLPEPVPKYAHSEACFFSSIPAEENGAKTSGALPDFTVARL